jgi:hypothetical protein
MRTSWVRCLPALLFAVLGLLGPAGSSYADIVNGDFADGLNGWTVQPPSARNTRVTAENIAGTTQARIRQPLPGTFEEVELFQDFVIPPEAEQLTFTLTMVTLNPIIALPPSAFGASLLDPQTGMSLVPHVPNSDSYYTRDLRQGPLVFRAAPGVTLRPSPGALPLEVSVDIMGLGGKNARILFRVLQDGAFSNASASITGVTTGAVIPEPNNLILGGLGAFSLFMWSCYRRLHY